MVLGKLPVPGRPTSLDDGRAGAYCACSRCGWGFVWIFFSLICLFSFLSPSLWKTARYSLKYCLKGPLNPKQPTKKTTTYVRGFFLYNQYIGFPILFLLIGSRVEQLVRVEVVWTFFFSSIISLFFLPLSGRGCDID